MVRASSLLLLAWLIWPLPAPAQTGPNAGPNTAPVAVSAGGAVLLTPANTLPRGPGRQRLAQVVFDSTPRPVLGADRNAPAHQLLRRLVAAGRAAGNTGDLYENRDRGHSRLPAAAFPQLTHVLYDDSFRREGMDYGLARYMLFDAPAIGNSSTALTNGPLWRSQPRMALTGDPLALQHLVQSWATGQIDVYPEHRDHDPERGDLLPANTPYMLISQGSSGSDKPHLEALAMILAAFAPDTKARLRETGLLAPTVQMVYRRARKGIRSRQDYFRGAAHPTAFRAGDIDLAHMVSLANAIRPENIPPAVRLKVLEETRAREGVDFFGEGLSETLFDTPAAIARIWRSRTGRRRMLISAAETRDPNGRPLTFHWSLLRGDPARVQITPLPPDGSHARIVMDWQTPQPSPGAPGILSHRIEIGVFAGNGVYDSAPAFISVLLPVHETRVYAQGRDGAPRAVSIDRGARDGVYADPALFPPLNWRDVYHYAADGTLTGWTRYRNGAESRYDARGRRLPPDGGPAAEVAYITRNTGGSLRVTESLRP